jgi:hypothetical protein
MPLVIPLPRGEMTIWSTSISPLRPKSVPPCQRVMPSFLIWCRNILLKSKYQNDIILIKKRMFQREFYAQFGLLFVILLLNPIFPSYLRINSKIDQNSARKQAINISTKWSLESISIDNNWSETAAKYDWCNGSGTKSDPYVIENIFFNTYYPNTGIIIKNEFDYFQIHNCVFFNCYKGIKLENVSNGDINNNNFTETYLIAIEIDNCNNMTISHNLLYDSQLYHIFIDSSTSVNISKNIIDTMGEQIMEFYLKM